MSVMLRPSGAAEAVEFYQKEHSDEPLVPGQRQATTSL